MGKLKRFDIVFNSAQGVFFAGQVVCGTVEVELSEAMKLRGERPIPVAIVKSKCCDCCKGGRVLISSAVIGYACGIARTLAGVAVSSRESCRRS